MNVFYVKSKLKKYSSTMISVALGFALISIDEQT